MRRKELHERRSLLWTWKTKEQGGLATMEGQGLNLQLSSGSRRRENNDAFDSDDGGEPGDILMEPLGLSPLCVQEGRGVPV